MPDKDRRTFLKTTALGAGTATLATALNVDRVHGANERIRIALIGSGGRGSLVARDFARLDGVEIAVVCDPDSGRAANAVKQLSNQPKPLNDFRAALDDKSIDAVIVATPDHWHAPAAIMAANAGKHVYVEKPCSHNLREGRMLVAAARRNESVVQHGTQSRSNPLISHAIRLLNDGVIGKVLTAKAWNVQRRGEIGHAEPSDPPSGLDYDMWVGPAPMVPFQANRLHYDWHWWYAFGTGDMGNDGVHELDIARWGLGVESHPSQVAALGAKLAFDDDQQFPDTQYAVFDYPATDNQSEQRQLIFEMRLWSRYGLEGVDNGNAFYGTEGWMLLSKRGIMKVFDERNRAKNVPQDLPKLSGHFQNFVDAIRGDESLRAEIEVGHRSASLCHLGNLAARLGESIRFDPKREIIDDNERANQLLGRKYRDKHWAVPGVA